MIKNTKRVLALMLAVAVIAMSMFTGVVVSATESGTIDLLEFGAYLTDKGSSSIYYDSILADNGETGDSWENAIIIDDAEEFVYLCKASGDDTKGKYYKVADGIKGFDLSKGDIDLDGTLAENIDKIKAGGKNHAGATPGFQGHFDGNGVTVYGAWSNHVAVSNYAGLFTAAKGEITIKNIHVNKAHFTAKYVVGGILGYHEADSMCTVTIENCSVTDSYLESQGTGYGTGVGAILGYGKSAPSYKDADGKTVYVNVAYNIKNCYVNLDEANFVSLAEDGVEDKGSNPDSINDDERACHGGVVAASGSNAVMVSDSVVIGVKPYATSESTVHNDVQHTGHANNFSNVYTDQPVSDATFVGGTNGNTQDLTKVMTQLTDDQLKGAAAMENMKLDWSVWMADAEGYPELRSAHKEVAFVDNGDGTHGEVCACGFGGTAAEHIWVDSVCACGAELDCGGRETIYWDGTMATGIATGSGTKDDPYVITAASEFAWLIQNATADNTAGKYFEIAENISAIVLQPEAFGEEIKALKNADEVKAYFEDKAGLVSWPIRGWEQGCFAGVFDGNYATVYGLYQVSASNAGLFGNVDAGAAIKNIALKNSYLTSTHGNYQVGGIAANTNSVNSKLGEEGQKPYGLNVIGAIWFDSCVVANNYMYNSSTSHDRSGVIIGASTDIVYMDNCLVYGNNATYGNGTVMPVWSGANNSTIVSDATIIPEGLDVVNDGAETPRYYNMVRDSIIYGATPYDAAQNVGSRFNDPKCFENVITDAEAGTFFSKVTDEQIKVVSAADIATYPLGDAWLNTTKYPELAAFHDAELDVVANKDGTHGLVCSCGFTAAIPCNFVEGKCTVCGASLSCDAKRTIYWDGTIANGFADTSAGTKDDPIIINSAAELAYLVSSMADVSIDKYFEMAADIGTIVLQPQEAAEFVLSLTSAEETQALFENPDIAWIEWPEKGWEKSCFAGSFDGKGVEIYGLYIVSDTNAALFPTVDAGASIHNVSVLNSYLYSQSTEANYQVGAIAAVTSNGTYGVGTQGVIWIEGCIVGNCYMRNDADDIGRSGVILGAASSDAVAIDNCLVYGNDAYHGADHATKMPLINAVSNSVVVPARAPAELDAKIQENANANGDSMYYNSVRNTIAFGTDIMNTSAVYSYRRNDPGCYENNYTDAAAGTVEFAGGGTWTYEDTQIKSVTLDTLNDNDLGSAWVKTDAYPELVAAHIVDINDNGDGTHSVSCSCGAVTGESAPHDMQDGVCTVCGATCVEHVEGKTVIENKKEASCDVNGSYDTVVYCKVCGGEISRVTTVVTAAHTPDEEVEEDRIDATCVAEGSYDMVVYCTVCDEEISRETFTTPIDPDAHTFDDENDTECNNGCGYGAITFTYGDVNDDGKINGRDYTLLMQFLNDWEVTINEDAADVNCDGKLNGRDYTLLMQFLNDWDVVIGPTA